MTDGEGARDDDRAKMAAERNDGEDVRAEYQTDKKCPECGAPIEDVRVSCPNCGYEYRESDYTDPEAGQDFVAGSEVDDQGNENIDPKADAEAPVAEEGDQEEQREPSLAAKIMEAGTGTPRSDRT